MVLSYLVVDVLDVFQGRGVGGERVGLEDCLPVVFEGVCYFLWVSDGVVIYRQVFKFVVCCAFQSTYLLPELSWLCGAEGFCVFYKVLPIYPVVSLKTVKHVPSEGVQVPLPNLILFQLSL